MKKPPVIRLFPDPVLRKSASFVRRFGTALTRTLETMEAAMKDQPSGIGIAAPQIGISQRIAIVDVSGRVQEASRLYLINPEILAVRDEMMSREGCMSLPEYTGTIKRYNIAHVRWQDPDGEIREKWTEGIEARCIQHEVDHLNGILFMDRVASLKTDLRPRKRNA